MSCLDCRVALFAAVTVGRRLLVFQTPEHLLSHVILNFIFFVGIKNDRHLWPGKRLLYLQNFALCIL